MPDKAAILNELRAARRELSAQLTMLTDEQVRQRPAPGEWSIIEVLAHLPDVDAHYLGQAAAIMKSPGHVFVPFDVEAWHRENGEAQERALEEVLSKMITMERIVLQVVEGLSEEDLARTGTHPRRGPLSAADCIMRVAAHDRAHAQQIAQIKAAIGTSS